jgi:hypothetical protein
MVKMNKTTRKNRKQHGGLHPDKGEGYGPLYGQNIHTLVKEANEGQSVEEKEEEEEEEEQKQNKSASWFPELKNPFSGLFSSSPSPPPATGGNKKQVNPAFGGYLKGGKKTVRNMKKHTKKRTGGNKCKCGGRNCRCSRKDCKCKCADKRFKCTCSSSTCGRNRTIKHRKH